MTGQPPFNYTDRDVLKQLTAHGLVTARSVEKLLKRVKQQSAASEDIELAITHASVLIALFTSAKQHVANSGDPDHYSDGRPVVGRAPSWQVTRRSSTCDTQTPTIRTTTQHPKYLAD
jgi:hypothetical protein